MVFIHSLMVGTTEVFQFESYCAAACPDVANSMIKLWKATHDVQKEDNIRVVTRSYADYCYEVKVAGKLFNWYNSKQKAEEIVKQLKQMAVHWCEITLEGPTGYRKQNIYWG